MAVEAIDLATPMNKYEKCDFSGLHTKECKPFVVEGFQVGLVRPDVMKQLLRYPEVNIEFSQKACLRIPGIKYKLCSDFSYL